MDKIYYDGDSFSCFGVEKNTGDFLAEYFNLELKHYGFNRKTYEQTIRSVMRYTFQSGPSNTFFCIGIGVANRLDAYSNIPTPIQHYNFEYWEEERHTHMVCAFDATTHHNNEIFLDQTENDFIRTKILFSLVTLHDYLLHNGHRFVIHNLDINYRLYRGRKFTKDIIEQVESRPRIVNFFENSLHDLMYTKRIRGFDYDQYGTMAHPAEDGHRMYAEFLTPYIEKYIE